MWSWCDLFYLPRKRTCNKCRNKPCTCKRGATGATGSSGSTGATGATGATGTFNPVSYGLQVKSNPFTARNNQGAAPDWSVNQTVYEMAANWNLSSDPSVWVTSKPGWYQVSWTVLLPLVQPSDPYTFNTWVETGSSTTTSNPFQLELSHIESNNEDTSIATWSQKVNLTTNMYIRVLVYQTSGQDISNAQGLLSIDFIHN